MNLKDIEKELDTMRSDCKINNYFLKRVSIDKYELEVHHKINDRLFCVLIDFNYEGFSTGNEIERLKKLMIENYTKYLK